MYYTFNLHNSELGVSRFRTFRPTTNFKTALKQLHKLESGEVCGDKLRLVAIKYTYQGVSQVRVVSDIVDYQPLKD